MGQFDYESYGKEVRDESHTTRDDTRDSSHPRDSISNRVGITRVNHFDVTNACYSTVLCLGLCLQHS